MADRAPVRMDAEDLRQVISANQKCVDETVRRFGGFVAKYMGDGVPVYWGNPQAHEDETERAVRAGLELIGAVSGQSMMVAMRATTGRFSLSTTGRALMLLNVNDSNRIPCTSRSLLNQFDKVGSIYSRSKLLDRLRSSNLPVTIHRVPGSGNVVAQHW